MRNEMIEEEQEQKQGKTAKAEEWARQAALELAGRTRIIFQVSQSIEFFRLPLQERDVGDAPPITPSWPRDDAEAEYYVYTVLYRFIVYIYLLTFISIEYIHVYIVYTIIYLYLFVLVTGCCHFRIHGSIHSSPD